MPKKLNTIQDWQPLFFVGDDRYDFWAKKAHDFFAERNGLTALLKHLNDLDDGYSFSVMNNTIVRKRTFLL